MLMSRDCGGKYDWGVIINPGIATENSCYKCIKDKALMLKEKSSISSDFEFQKKYDIDWVCDEFATYLLNNQFNLKEREDILAYMKLADAELAPTIDGIEMLAGLGDDLDEKK